MYLREHSKPATRRLHFFGTVCGILFAVAAVTRGNGWFVLLGLVVAYGIAWFSHFFVEKNRPATFRYPFWSFVSDFRMLWWMLRGKL